MLAWKLLRRRKDGKLVSPFINARQDQIEYSETWITRMPLITYSDGYKTQRIVYTAPFWHPDEIMLHARRLATSELYLVALSPKKTRMKILARAEIPHEWTCQFNGKQVFRFGYYDILEGKGPQGEHGYGVYEADD